MAIILNQASAAFSVTKVYRERLKKNAELVAKKELVSLSTAIDSAALKGQDHISFKLSSSVTKLTDEYRTIAIGIIEQDLRDAGYDAMRAIVNEAVTGYEISWADAEEEQGNGDPEPSEQEEDPDIQSPEDLIAAINANNEVELTLSNDLALAVPVLVPTGHKAIVHLNNTIENNAQIAFQVDGGELVIDGEGEITGTGRAIVAQNGGKVIIDGGTYTSTAADEAIVSMGTDTEIIINDATVNSQEFALMALDGATLTVNGGTYTTVDNCVVGTTKGANHGNNTINISNATLRGHIESEGYAACGVFVANNDTVNIENSEIITENGCGILMRAGSVTVRNTQITTTGTNGGYVGDTSSVVSNSGIIYDQVANYVNNTDMSLVYGPEVTFNCSGETVEILSDEETPNVTVVP